ncbi:hypothetical protein VZC37_19625 [Gordonia sp. LSe1-13]|uniref:Nucleotidyltransferase n=1 Tax=Gordonia sesuvii TaxID=3116777 RepID=A0ABU7MIZ6_9ACTN|nr:hypothetical protein [Gordonia sp. LSe1-13]
MRSNDARHVCAYLRVWYETEVIPSLSEDGHLPPGRYRCTLPEFADRFVHSREFDSSTTRRKLFDSLLRYLVEWQLLIDGADDADDLLKSVWIAGSYASGKLDPADIDVSPVVNGVVAERVRTKGLKRLTQDRGSIKRRFDVEVFPIEWRPVPGIFSAGGLRAVDAAYFEVRGKMDDFWQRCRLDDAVREAPTVEECETRRGYLEVMIP